MDEETVGRWVRQYQEQGLGGLRNDAQWGGEHGQRELSCERWRAEAGVPRRSDGGDASGQWLDEQGGAATNRRALWGDVQQEWDAQALCASGVELPAGAQALHAAGPGGPGALRVGDAAVLAKYARNGQKVVPLASDQSKVYLEGTLGRRWNPIGQQPVVADGARQKRAENLYGAVHLGTGAEVAPFAIDWQDSDATIRWYELLLAECPQGQILLWQDQAPHHTSEEVEEWLATQPRIEVIAFPKYTPEENPKEATWKDLKEEVSHHHWHETMAELRTAIDDYYQAGKKHVVNFLQKFGYRWRQGVIEPLPQTV